MTKPERTRGRPAPSATDPKRPYHLGVAIGITSGVYAASLLVAARLQIETDRALIADRTPVEAAISALGDHHDWMDDRLGEARTAYSVGASGYEALIAKLEAMDARLSDLGATVASVEKLGNSLATSLDLPGVPRFTSSGTQKGSSGSGTKSGSGSGTAIKPPPAPKPTPPPPTSGQTGASGAP